MPQYFIAGMVAGLCCLPVTVCVERVKCVMQVWNMEYAVCKCITLVLRFNMVAKCSQNTQALGTVLVSYTGVVVLVIYTREPWQQC